MIYLLPNVFSSVKSETFSRAGKSEQLSVDLQEADQKVEFFRGALTAVGKRLGPNSAQGPNTEVYEKRLVRNKILSYNLKFESETYFLCIFNWDSHTLICLFYSTGSITLILNKISS